MTRLIVCLLSLPMLGQPVRAQDLESLEQEALSSAAAQVARSVVRIETIGGLARAAEDVVGPGLATSGVVADPDGYIVSSAFNFLQPPTSILVQLPDGTRKPADIVARDHSRQLVLLKIDVDTPLEVPSATTKADIQAGQWAVTVGRTLSSSDFNMTVGIVSAKDRVWGRALQTDAAVSPANYGGALVDVWGRMLGVLVHHPDPAALPAPAEWYDSGIGFAIPWEDVLSTLDQFKQGDLHAGKLGIDFRSDDAYGAEPIVEVSWPKSPAREAGLQPGDRITAVNGRRVRSENQVKQVLGPLRAGEAVELEIDRKGIPLRLSVQLVEQLLPYEHAFLGILPVRQVAGAASAGVALRYVFPESPADKLGLKPDDVITAFNDVDVRQADQLRGALAGVEPGEEVPLIYIRGGETIRGEAELDTLPQTLPATLPPAYAGIDEINEDLPPLGTINIKLPEEAAECRAYIPQSYDPRFAHSLLVVLPVPGRDTLDAVIRDWQQVCDEQRVLLLVPEAEQSRKWSPSEATFIRKTIENLKKDYSVGEQRIAIFGEDNSGAMAFLTAFTHRDLVRGVWVVNAAIPSSSPLLLNEPLQRLTVVVAAASDHPLIPRMKADVQRLTKAKIPVVSALSQDAGVVDRAKLMRWLDSLDRI